MLLFLIIRCTPTIRELIVATPLSETSPSTTGLSALAPAQRAGAQRLCAMAHFGNAAMSDLSPLSGAKRKLDFGAVRSALTRRKHRKSPQSSRTYALDPCLPVALRS